MGFLKKARNSWKAMRTADKIGVIVDLICGAGAAVINKKVGDKLCEGSGSKIERGLIRITTFGMVTAGADAGSRYIKKNYGEVAGLLIDASSGKTTISGVTPTKDGLVFEEERHE